MTAEDVRSVVFQKAAVGGYKTSDVDLFLDEVAVCIENMTAKIRSLEKAKFEAGQKGAAPAEPAQVEIEKPVIKQEPVEVKSNNQEGVSDYGIQTLLLRAQKLAEQIEAEARQASEELLAKSAEDAQDIIARADSAAAETIEKANAVLADAQRKEASINAAARAEAENIINEAVARSGQMLTTTREKLKEERLMCEKLRTEFNQVRGVIIGFYEEQLGELKSEEFERIANVDLDEGFEEIETAPVSFETEEETAPVSFETEEESSEESVDIESFSENAKEEEDEAAPTEEGSTEQEFDFSLFMSDEEE